MSIFSCSIYLGNLSPCMLQLPRLFDGCRFFLSGPFEYPTPSRDDLGILITLGGGTVLHREPKLEQIEEQQVPYHACTGRCLEWCDHYVVRDETTGGEMRGPRLCDTSATWLLDCITRFQLIEPV